MSTTAFYTGVVENRDDPLRLGRCQVRIVGLHTEDKSILPSSDLPWAYPMQPINSASINGIGWTPTGPVLGTWVMIIFRDDDQQYPVMIGTIGGIPQSKAAEHVADQAGGNVIATNGGVVTDPASGEPLKTADGTKITVGTADATNSSAPGTPAAAPEPSITDQKEPNKPSDASLKKDIPTDPPKGSSSNPSKAKQNIQYLIEACDKVGLTSKYAKCAILGICGGESAWLAVEEGSYYSSADSLSKIFKRSFPTPADAQPYVKWTGSKADFFRKIYSPSGNGALLGHKDPNDGAKYYGRGFNQITGRSLYIQLQKFLATKGITVDFENNPQSLIEDPKTAALATAAFYALNVKHNQNDPGYFVVALKRTGADANGTGYEKKKKYYEYFLGEAVTVDSTNKPSADQNKTYTAEEVANLPASKRAALLEDRSSNATVGFCDPEGKYPLRNLLDEPDTNRLARGVQKETAIEFKDSTRTKEIPAANGDSSWEQPLAPFGGKYPYNKVYETESGHLMVFDDTPTHENISLYHKTGTFFEVDANGTQVNKIVGDGYAIYDRNGSIFIAGRANVTVGNGINLYVQGAADIEINGEANINLHNNANIGVGGDLNLAVGGDIKVSAGGSIDMKAAAAFGIESTNDMTIVSAANINQNAAAAFGIQSVAATTIDAGGAFAATAGSTAGIKAGGDAFVNAGGSANMLATGAVALQGSTLNMQDGSAQAAPAVAKPSVEPAIVELTAPEFQGGTSDQFGYLSTPVRPSPPLDMKIDISNANNAQAADYAANPDKYYNAAAAEGGVKGNYAGTPADDGQGKSLIGGGTAGDIQAFLRKQLDTTASNGYWREMGQGGKPSNPNITRIWADLGYPTTGMWTSDQTAWCMGFVNWTLKQCGYRYVQTASAKEIANNPKKWNAVQVQPKDAQPGDIVLWNYSHVNFVYTANNGKLTFVGGNQSPSKGGNNPNDGDVTNSWPGGWTEAKGGIVGIFRPSKT